MMLSDVRAKWEARRDGSPPANSRLPWRDAVMTE
jgi:hypothetical protein